jgi:hypothetical protein
LYQNPLPESNQSTGKEVSKIIENDGILLKEASMGSADLPDAGINHTRPLINSRD